jgi:glutamate-1-semialdehyde 2,1-aminomutase
MNATKASDAENTLSQDAQRVMPAGGFGNLGFEAVIREGRGSRIWDMEGNEYIDYLMGSGPMILGHAHPEVTDAVMAQVPRGTTFFANNEPAIQLAAEIVDAVACADKVRFVSSGSEATFYAMRAARAYRGRDKILKFEGGFHGMSDYALMSMAPAQPGNFPQAQPDTAGIPQSVRDEMLIAPYNDAETAKSLIKEHHDELGGVIVEPFQRLYPPAPGFLQSLREVTAEYGIPLIFDEVVTGFRFAYGGAQAYYGVTPDICALGKTIGGGFPLAAIAGSDAIMAHFDKPHAPDGRFVPMIGTLSGNPVAAVAGLATLAVLKRPGAYDTLFETGRQIREGLGAILRKAGITAVVSGDDPLFDVVFGVEDVHDYRSAAKGNAQKLARFNELLRERGVFKGDSKFYISLAHTDDDVSQTLDALDSAIKAL